jgi:uncharacterized protein DUF6484
VARLVGINDSGEPLIRHSVGQSGCIVLARTTVTVTREHVDRAVVIAFESGNLAKPIIMGFLKQPDETTNVPPAIASRPMIDRPIVRASLDGERLLLTAEDEIVLKCGDASLTLTRAGKVLLAGNYVLSRSKGVNRIRGGSVQIN